MQVISSYARPVYIVDGQRTPWLKAREQPGVFSALELAVQVCRSLLMTMPFHPNQLDEVIAACMMPDIHEANIARLIALRTQIGQHVPAYTVQRNCASGMQALDNAASNIASGRSHLVLAGGTESMSYAPVLLQPRLIKWWSEWRLTKHTASRLKLLKQFRFKDLLPTFALSAGLTDPIIHLSMGQTAEIIADQFNITRQAMDEFALISHRRLAKAQDEKFFSDQLCVLYDNAGHYYDHDDGLRRNTTLEKLAALPVIFDKPFGLITAGNSSQITDGAAFLLLASEEAVQHYSLPVLARLVDVAWVGVDPAYMGLAPVHAATKLLQRYSLNIEAIDYWELNEAFAGQVLACLAAWQSDDYCRQSLGLPQSLGEITLSRLNVDGGAIAMGHPISATGARLVLHLAKILKRHRARRGIATLCIGGGQGGAMLIENVDEVA